MRTRGVWSVLSTATILIGSSIIGLAVATVASVWAGVAVGWMVAVLSNFALFVRAYPSEPRPWRRFAQLSILFVPIGTGVFAWQAEDRSRWPDARKICPECTRRVEADAAICAQCGHIFEPDPEVPKSRARETTPPRGALGSIGIAAAVMDDEVTMTCRLCLRDRLSPRDRQELVAAIPEVLEMYGDPEFRRAALVHIQGHLREEH